MLHQTLPSIFGGVKLCVCMYNNTADIVTDVDYDQTIACDTTDIESFGFAGLFLGFRVVASHTFQLSSSNVQSNCYLGSCVAVAMSAYLSVAVVADRFATAGCVCVCANLFFL